MSVRISEIIKRRGLKKLNKLTTDGGMSNEVTNVNLADYELDSNLAPYGESLRRGSFVIASMRLESKFEGSDLKTIVEKLIQSKASALAFNNREVKKASKQVIDICEKNELALFSYDPEELYVDNIVFEIHNAIEESSIGYSKDREIEKLLQGNLSNNEIEKLALGINPDFLRTCTVSYIKAKDSNSDFNIGKITRTYTPGKQDQNVITSLIGYREGLVVIISMPRMDFGIRDKILYDIVGGQTKAKSVIMASSSEHVTYEELDLAFLECSHAFVAGSVDGINKIEYDNIGIWKILIPGRDDPGTINFMRKYIRSMNREQLETAITFIECDGDYDLTAEKMICHRNTIRYRINQIHKKTDPDASDFVFYTNLDTAIKLYLINCDGARH